MIAGSDAVLSASTFSSSVKHSLDGDSGGGRFGLPVISAEIALEHHFNRFVEFNRDPRFRDASFYNAFDPPAGELVHNFLTHQISKGDLTGARIALARLLDGDSKRLSRELMTTLQTYQPNAESSLYHELLSSPHQPMRIHRLLEQLLRAGYPTEQPRDEESLFEYALNNNKFYALRLIARRDVDPRLQPGEQAAQRLRLVEERLHKLTERAHYLQLEQKDLDEGAALLRVAGRLMTQTHNPGALDIPPPHRGMQSISILFLAHPTLRNTFKHANAGGEIRRSLFEQEKEPEQRKNLNVILDWLPTAQAADVDNLYGTIAALVEARCSLSAMSAIVFN